MLTYEVPEQYKFGSLGYSYFEEVITIIIIINYFENVNFFYAKPGLELILPYI